MSNNYKEINGFLYCISDNESEVTIARKAVLSNIAGQLMVANQMDCILCPTGYYRDVVFDGHIYVGIVYYNTIPEEELIAALSAKLV